PACLVCRDSKKHIKHRFRPIDEAAPEHKDEVKTLLKPLQKKLEAFNKFKTESDKTAEHIKVRAQHAVLQMKEQFKKMHQFIQKEEE
ncbi:hypothetical protein, partial [Nocardioides malaquae]|uniref:hypothetical protein n=1 Tax=Nocardioides malaquae TaxID=2773426 RepID=UPI001D0CFAB8